MRLDKYLKISRLVKRRTVANELCDHGHVQINHKVAKASTEIKTGDVITLKIGAVVSEARVLIVPTKAVSIQEAETLFERLSTP